MPSLTEVAKKAGVSLSTASVVLNPGSRKKTVSPELVAKVKKAAAETGYVTNFLAQAMKRGRTNSIGLALHTGRFYENYSQRLSNEYHSAMVSGIEFALARRGYTLLILGSTEEQLATERAAEALQQRQIDGLICNTDLFCKTCPDTDLPVVLLESSEGVRYPSIHWDDVMAVQLAVDHLADYGHKNFLWLGPEREEGSTQTDSRETIFSQEMRKHDFQFQALRFKRRWVKNPVETFEEIVAGAAYKTLKDNLSENADYSAIVCYNDTVACGAYRALMEAGFKIPADMSVIGFDDFLTSKLIVPALTTVNHMFNEIGEEAVDLLIQSIENLDKRQDMKNTSISIKPELVIRNSTAKV